MKWFATVREVYREHEDEEPKVIFCNFIVDNHPIHAFSGDQYTLLFYKELSEEEEKLIPKEVLNELTIS